MNIEFLTELFCLAEVPNRIAKGIAAHSCQKRSGPGSARGQPAWGGGCDGIILVSFGHSFQIDNRQLEIGNDFTPPPLASNDLFARRSQSGSDHL
jgi:hypothetical protein